MKKIFLFSIGLLLFLATEPLQARNFYVKTNGSNALAGTNWTAAWDTIGYAATNMGSGDAVIVSNGIYREDVILTGSRCTFRSLNKGQAVVIGSYNCFNVVGYFHTVIDGFILKKAGDYCIRGPGGSGNTRIINNIIYSNTAGGISLQGNPFSNVICSNMIYGANQGNGIYIVDGSHNVIRFNQVHNLNRGLYFIGDTTGNYMAGNVICSNDNNGIEIDATIGGNNLILTNDIWGLNQNYGVFIRNSSRNTVQLNKIHNNASGMLLDGNARTNHVIQNSVYSNKNTGIEVSNNADNNFILLNDIWSTNQIEGISISQCDDNIIQGNRIRRNKVYGLFLQGTVTGNCIYGNSIRSNGNYGLFLPSMARNNIIRSNDVSRNSQEGIYLNGSDRNILCANRIHHNGSSGLYLENTALSNNIVKNRIYTNTGNGINVNSGGCRQNFIQSNAVFGPGQFTGIRLFDTDRNTIGSGNSIYNNSLNGILLTGNASSNVIRGNEIRGNTMSGIYINSDTADYNVIRSNQFYSQSQPISIFDGDNSIISRNLFKQNLPYHILISGSALDTSILNNTIFGIPAQSGILCVDTSSGYILNNIIMSNQEYAVTNSSTGTFIIDHNVFYANAKGKANSGVILGPSIITQDPMIDTVSTFAITSAASPAVDSGTNIPGITDGYYGPGPDMGWKEYISDSTAPVTTASKGNGFYSAPFDVVLTAADPEFPNNITIYYTTDGSDPLTSSTVLSGISPVTVSIDRTTTLKFYAKNSFGLSEAVQTLQYDFIKLPSEDAAVYNNHLDLSKAEPARIIFGKACTVEVKVYNVKGILVKSWPSRHYDAGQYQDWYGTFRDSTKKVGAGLYIILIKGDINKKLKITVTK
ncbi:MAG: right-handed parallel beta-helix repeat-containing protein [bacterium]|nr:right-handed parallel beta-helix repeat-containing protein [bacterium]